jgi:hypothetical protein
MNNLPKGSWINSSRNYRIENNFLITECKNIQGQYIKNKIKIEDNQTLTNINGKLVSNKKNKFAHLINPFKCNEDNPSYLYYAQPITFKTMYNAKIEANKISVKVDLFCANFPEDDEIIPDYFIKLPHLQKSTKSLFPNIKTNKKLPIIQEMLMLVYKNTDADYIIFTNSDISVQKNFYTKINNIINNQKLKSFVINRRDDLPKFKNGKRLTENNLDILYKEKGKKHPGKDCFIIHRSLIQKINMGNMFIGYSPWGNTLNTLLKNINKNHKVFEDLYLTFHLGDDKAWRIGSTNPKEYKNEK